MPFEGLGNSVVRVYATGLMVLGLRGAGKTRV